MLFLIVSAEEFTLFIQTLLWVFLPLAVVSISIATYVHYRRKKKSAAEADAFTYPDRDAQPVMPASKSISVNEDIEEGYQGVRWIVRHQLKQPRRFYAQH